MILPEGIALLLALAGLAIMWDRASWMIQAARDWLSPAHRARRLAEDAAYERWKREGGGAWFNSWWDTPAAPHGQTTQAAAAPLEVPGRMSTEEARRKLDALLELTVARGATPAEAATARAIAERLKAEYGLR